jgi:hypothetical protein
LNAVQCLFHNLGNMSSILHVHGIYKLQHDKSKPYIGWDFQLARKGLVENK